MPGTEARQRQSSRACRNSRRFVLTLPPSIPTATAIQVFTAHNEDVRRSVPREKLLIYESGEGWEPLCDFLGVPVPAAPYPKVNTTCDFVSRFPGKS